MTWTRIFRDRKGSAAIEFAIAVPVLVSFIVGIIQTSVYLQANAGVQHALGEGARVATIYDPTTGSRPPDEVISETIVNSKFGIRGGDWHEPVIDSTNEASDGYIDITVQYDVPTDFFFFPGPAITLQRTKRVFTQA
ncbi:MAG TPA: TadE family protein [Sphingomicrobium sp.]|nr:TadE family protein [Sphingomicrobium sp.]